MFVCFNKKAFSFFICQGSQGAVGQKGYSGPRGDQGAKVCSDIIFTDVTNSPRVKAVKAVKEISTNRSFLNLTEPAAFPVSLNSAIFARLRARPFHELGNKTSYLL